MSAMAGQALGGAAVARIGPNAITQVAAVLERELGAAVLMRLFKAAGLSAHLARPPTGMVDDREVERLHRVLRAELGVAQARRIGRLAGERTGAYLLTHRIPSAVQRLLRWLPAAWAARLLVRAIGRHAWTFTGAGAFTARVGPPLQLVIRHGPLARGDRADEPVCDFYAATFAWLFRALVHPNATVVEVECEALGAPSCVFELRWSC